jgi:CheY-like chemotaxis protein
MAVRLAEETMTPLEELPGRGTEMDGPRPRLMFVDDEPSVLYGLGASLRKLRRTWDMQFVLGGESALAALDAGPFDAVITDMRMPAIDGEAVLRRAKERCPGAVRVILSGQTDPNVVLRSIDLAHQYLSKPCPGEELRGCIAGLLDAVALMNPALRAIVCAVSTVSVFEETVADLLPLLDASPIHADVVARCIARDVGLSARLMHVSGAGFFGQRQAVQTVERAVDLLGAGSIRAIVQSMPAARGGPVPAGRDGSFHEALGLRVLTDRFGEADAGLSTSASAASRGVLRELEQARFGVTHEEVGRHLAALWGIVARA